MRWYRAGAGLSCAAVGLALAFAVGPLSTVSTHGISMQPRMSAGDLVVIAPTSSYEIGDVAAYRSAELDTVVLHRIVDIDGDRYVMRGDNNSWLDPEKPTVDDVIGKELLHIPRGGIWLDRLTSPSALAAYAFLLLAGGSAARTRRERKKERRTMSPRHRTAPSRSTAGLPPVLKPVAAGAAVVGLTGLALSGIAWTRPTDTTVSASSSVETTMDFSYTAQVPQTPAYDGTTVTAPQPVFRALADTVEVTYRYAGRPGTLVVSAELSTDSGWRSGVPLTTAEPVGAEHGGSVTLDLQQLQERADAAGEVIGIPASGLTVAVVPTVTLDGGGSFAPRLELSLDAQSLEPTGELSATEATSTDGTRIEPTRLSALGRSLDVSTARTAGGLAVLAALLAAAVVATLARLSGPVSEVDRVRRRYGDLILPVMPMVLAAGRPVVDVPDIDSLTTLAERYGLLVLAWSRGGVDTYVVQDEGTTFRYRSGTADVTPAPTRHDVTVLPQL